MRHTQALRARILSSVVMAALLLGCNGDLQVTSKDMTTNQAKQVVIKVGFNKAVERATVTPGTSLILSGGNMNNAPGNLTWTDDRNLTFTSTNIWSEIAGGGTPDTGVTLTLKASIKAQDGSSIEQCRSGRPGTEAPGDCVLFFVIPG